jgi:hypothetical protein
MQTLPCHSHSNLAWDRRSAEARLVLPVLFCSVGIAPTRQGSRTSRINTGRPSMATSESSRMARCASSGEANSTMLCDESVMITEIL